MAPAAFLVGPILAPTNYRGGSSLGLFLLHGVWRRARYSIVLLILRRTDT